MKIKSHYSICTMVLIICLPLIGRTQIRVQKQGRVSMGNATPSATDQLWIAPGGNDRGIVIDHVPAQLWFQSMSTYSHNQKTAHYVVKDMTLNGTPDVYFVSGAGWIYYSNGSYLGSDSKLKYDVKKIDSPLEKVLKMNGVTYSLKSEIKTNEQSSRYVGLIAQEVENIIPEVVKTMPDGIKAISYPNLVAVLIEAVKEQNNLIEKNAHELSDTKEQLNTLNEKLVSCCNNINNKAQISDDDIKNQAILYQNLPNPFNKISTIKYFIPNSFNSSSIKVFSMDGIEVKSYKITATGKGEIQIEASSLKPGTYVYHLIIDGVQIDAKLMTIVQTN